jgi:hypothetical protein
MLKYNVKFNKNEIIVKDNHQSIFKSKNNLNKKYFKSSNKNICEITMIAYDHSHCLEKAKNFYKTHFNKEATCIEIRQTNPISNVLRESSNKQYKLVA